MRTVRKGEPARAAADLPGDLTRLVFEVVAVLKAARRRASGLRPARAANRDGPQHLPAASMTRSGLFAEPSIGLGGPDDPHLSGDYSTIDMVNRLEPVGWHWIESSPAEQGFLGWTLDDLKTKSFLDIVHPDDRDRVEATFTQALERGEALGLIVRIRTAQGKTRAIEVNAGARYGNNQKVAHLRCHLTDVTEKVRAERELRLRTFELTQSQRTIATNQPRARGPQGPLYRPV